MNLKGCHLVGIGLNSAEQSPNPLNLTQSQFIDRVYLKMAETLILSANGDRDRALFGICLYTRCRISEACSMLTTDAYDAAGVRMKITLRKSNTKGKQETRQIPVNSVLKGYLETYRTRAGKQCLFPGRHGRGHINPKSADEILRETCDRLGLVGVSTHSFRRTALTQMSSAGVPLRVIQEIIGAPQLTSTSTVSRGVGAATGGGDRGSQFLKAVPPFRLRMAMGSFDC